MGLTSKQAAELHRRAGSVPPPDIDTPDASKFNARRKTLDGHTFASTGEAAAYTLLKSWEQCGAIRNLVLQPVFGLQEKFRDGTKTHRAIKYQPDFQFTGPEGEIHVIEFKGMRTPAYRIKLKLFRAKYPDVLFEEWDRDMLRTMERR